jgi:hypothetical protein
LWAHKLWNDRDPFSRFERLDRADHTAEGGMIGGQIGCDYQFGRFVVGIEGSYHWSMPMRPAPTSSFRSPSAIRRM